MLKISEILDILPHRYPFLLVDRIEEIDPGKRIVCVKNVTINEPFFQGHFPGYPIMPGVLIIEAMAQAGGVLAFKSSKNSDKKLVYFIGIDNARFRKSVFPGDQIRLEVEVLQERHPYWRLKGMSYVSGELVCEAELLAKLADREDK